MATPQLTFRQSLVASITIHLILLVIISLLLTKSPFKQEVVPIVVMIDAPTAMAEGAEASPSPPTPKATPKPIQQPKASPTTTKQEAQKTIEQAREKIKRTTTTSKPVQSTTPSSSEPISTPSPQPAETEDDILAKSIEKALQSTGRQGKASSATPGTGQQGTGTDPLGDASWKSRPRKTIFFPDIAAKIREKVPNPLMGYVVTAKIIFDNQGLAVRVEIVRSSGDPLIDSIFLSELKKIRVEAISDDRLDEITKTFNIGIR